MGSATNAAIAKWQDETGIKPATGGAAAALKQIADLGAELISITALEASGIRDGDGYWHGSDPLDGIIRNLHEIWGKECRQENQPEIVGDDDEIPW